MKGEARKGCGQVLFFQSPGFSDSRTTSGGKCSTKLRSILPILKPFPLPDSPPPPLAFEKKCSSGVGTPGPFLGNEVSVRRILGVVVPTVTLRTRISFSRCGSCCPARERDVCAYVALALGLRPLLALCPMERGPGLERAWVFCQF